jgi:hypothetical protein
MSYKSKQGNTVKPIAWAIGVMLLMSFITTTIPPSISFAQPSNNINSSSNSSSSSSGSSISNSSNKKHNETQGIFGVTSSPYGLTYAEWTAKWWQWAYSIPKNINPAFDDTGIHCTVNQNGPVWFFPGAYGKDVTRHCTVPSDKAILFPILNSECSLAEFPNLRNYEQLRQCAKQIQDSVIQLNASIDGKNIGNLEQYRIGSPLFNFTLPQNNILGLPPQSTQAVSDGNWIFLEPLSEGNHTISFKGGLRNDSDSKANNSYVFAVPHGWDNNVTYHLTVIDHSNI